MTTDNSRVDDGGPAFPNTGSSNWKLRPVAGMTLRDWFAGQALAGLCANSELLKQMPGTLRLSKQFGADDFEGAYANMARKFADAMLAARKGGGE